MIFVTATMIDPAGNRVHSDDELPFAQSTIPPQQPGVDGAEHPDAPAVKNAVVQPDEIPANDIVKLRNSR